jgi:integrase
MNRRRKSSRTLTGSRIYIRRGKYSYFSPEPLFNPGTGKTCKWHVLCPVADGELKSREVLNALLGRQCASEGRGDFSVWFGKWRTQLLQQRDRDAPHDPPMLKIWKDGTKALLSQLSIVEKAFSDFDLVQVRPADVATFVDQWEGRRSAQSYKGHLRKFLAWCCRKGLLDVNVAREVTVDKPPSRDVLITDEQWFAIRDALLIGDNGKKTRTGEMVQCYMDLLYLFHQRGTEIRLLRWDRVKDDGIEFKPSKTEGSSGAKVLVPIGDDALEVLARAKRLKKMRSIYVIHTEHGQPYTAHGVGSLFARACKRAGVAGVTLKDIRPMAATGAKKAGYSDDEIQVALAHTDKATTLGYLKSREIPISKVVLKLPQR